MFVRTGKIFLVMALSAMLGAHWTLLQTVAWTTMLADNLQANSFSEALNKTLDGKHPCCLCKAIAAGKKSEQKNEFSLQKQKIEFPLLKENFILVAPSSFEISPLKDSFANSFTQKPLLLPPRHFFV